MTFTKIEKARLIAKCGKYPITFRTILDSLPINALERLSANDIADIVDLIYEEKWNVKG